MLDSRLKTEIPALVAPAVARPAIARACDSAVIRDVRGTGERHAHLATLPRALTADWEGSECVDPGGAELMKCLVVFAAMDNASEAAVKYAAAQHTAKAE